MSKEFLGDRKQALEDAFFAKQDEALLRRLRETEAAKTKKEALSAASGISDDAVLTKLIALGVDGAAVASLSLAPLVLVAWADGEVEPKERGAVLAAAVEAGVDKGGAGYRLLENWLTKKPPSNLFAAWTDYIHAITSTMSDQGKRDLKADLVGRARTVAEAAGGVLGAGWKTSPVEKDMLARLEKAFSA